MHLKTVVGINWQWDYFSDEQEAVDFLYVKQAAGHRGECYRVNAVGNMADTGMLGGWCVHWRSYGPDARPHGPYAEKAASKN